MVNSGLCKVIRYLLNLVRCDNGFSSNRNILITANRLSEA
jgi:hypothetical protein